MANDTQKHDEQSYFERLEFDPQLMQSWVANFIGNFRIVLLLIITICLLGTVSYFSLPKRLNPEVKIPIVSVVTVLPGASPADVESLVSVPLENHLQSAVGLDTMTSTSRDNVSVVTLQFVSAVDRDKALNDTQSLVDTFNNLPDDAQDPTVTALDFEDTPIWTFVLTTDGDERSLMSFTRHLKTQLEELSRVDRVQTNGFEEQEVVVAVAPEKVQQYGVNPLQLSQAIKQGLSSFPGGAVESATNQYAITISPTLYSIEDIRKTLISLQGKVIPLSEIATVEERSKPNQAVTFTAGNNKDPKRAVTVYVYKTTASSIDDAGEQVHLKVDELMKEQGDRYQLKTLSNTSEDINEQFTDLVGEFKATIILVFICIFLFLGFRQAVISSFTVPLTFLSAFVFMNLTGMSINFLSLFAFLLAMGLLVDDTIVVISAMTAYYRTGKFTPLQSGLLVWKDTIIPIWSTTLTTIWSFAPLLLTTGIIGEFIKPIPVVVTVTMLSSTAIAVLVTLPIMVVILKPEIPVRVQWLLKIVTVLLIGGALLALLSSNPLLPIIGLLYLVLAFSLAFLGPRLVTRSQDYLNTKNWWKRFSQWAARSTEHGLINTDWFAETYHRMILRVIENSSSRWKVIIASVVYAVACFALLPLGFVKNEFFPSSDQELVYVQLQLPSGSTLSTTEGKALTLLEKLRHTPDTELVVAEVGRASGGGFGGGSQENGNSALYTLHLPVREERERSSMQIAEDLRKEYAGYVDGRVTIEEMSGGPPAGADLQINLAGQDLNELNRYADEISKYLAAQPGVTNVDKSIKSGTSQVKFIPDAAKLADAGIGVDSIGLWLRIYASGFKLDEINLDTTQQDKTDIMFRLGSSDATLDGLSKISVVNNQGVAYPLTSLGRLEAQPNPTVINREDGSRTLAVTAAVSDAYSVSDKNKELEAFADSLNLADGYSWTTGGVNEENQKSINSMLQAMGVSVILILVTMVIQFGSFRQAFIVLIVIPLAISSVFLAFALTGTPLSFPALIGVLSLFGIVVTNSMFIVDKINLNLKEGMPFKEAIADAGSSRLEPIILTKLCTVFGLLPITIADPLWRGLGGAIISGLLLASTIMLLFIPAVYYNFFQHEDETTQGSKALTAKVVAENKTRVTRSRKNSRKK